MRREGIMDVVGRRQTFERDPQAYVADFEAYLQGWEGTEEERDLALWLTLAQTGTDDPDVFRFVALGYVVGTWEEWSDSIGEERLDLFEKFGREAARVWTQKGIPNQLHDPLYGAGIHLYGAGIMGAQLADVGHAGDATLVERVDLIWNGFVVPNTRFETPPSSEALAAMRSLFNLGIGLYLFLRWYRRTQERSVPEEEME